MAAAAVIGCSSSTAPMAAMDAAPPVTEVQPTLVTATLSVAGMH
jgi:hypothetical protein